MSGLSFHDGKVTLYHGDCLVTLDSLPENSVDSVVCDPPYHLTSIVESFGSDDAAAPKIGNKTPMARLAKGFMSKSWDGGDIAFRVETWAKVLRVLKPGGYILAFSSSRTFGRMSVAIEDAGFITHPMIGWIFGSGFPKATRIKAEGYEGQRYGAQSLKPALEPIYMGQKPFSEDTGTANILRWGTGAVNIDACRVNTGESLLRTTNGHDGDDWHMGAGITGSRTGRWPANVITDGSDEVVAAFPQTASNGGGTTKTSGIPFSSHTDIRNPAKPVPCGDTGSAARFFYASKADDNDRLNSRHPTVKPLDLIRYLVRLVTPKNGLVLDCFAGTGTTAHAALIEGCRAILCEREDEYVADITRRMGLVFAGQDERRGKLTVQAEDHGPLFGSVA